MASPERTVGFAFPKVAREKRRPRRIRPINRERRERRRMSGPPPAFLYGKTVTPVIDDEYRRQVCEGGCVLSRRAPAVYQVGYAMLQRESTPCGGKIHPHHPRYMGQGANIKTPDLDCFGLCAVHHREVHRGTGSFSVIGVLPEEFQREMTSATQARFASHGSRRSG